MAIQGVAVKPKLGVQQFQAAIGHGDQRVDLKHLHVFFGERFVQLAHQVHTGLDLFPLKPERKRDPTAVKRLIPGGGINAERQDFFRGRRGDLFDVHAAFGGTHERNAACLAINQKGQVQFAFNVAAVFDVDAVDLFACRAGLMGDKRAPQHLLGLFGGFFDGLGKANAALVARIRFLEFALAASARVYLRFDNPKRAVHFARGCFGVFGLKHRAAVRYWTTVFAKQSFCLVFMDVHEVRPSIAGVTAVMPSPCLRMNGFLHRIGVFVRIIRFCDHTPESCDHKLNPPSGPA